MTSEERNTRADQIADFRLKLVAELANPYLSAAERRRLICQKAGVEHDVPGLGRRRLSESCIRKWLALYRDQGKEGLLPRSRRDEGESRSLSKAEAALLLNYLQEKPDLTATAVLKRLRREGKITSCPSSSSLSRLVRSAGLDRRHRLAAGDAEQNLKFDFFAPLECVQADCMYGPKLDDGKGRKRYAILLTFLDDATRRILYADFAFSESSILFEAGIKHILAAHGRIGRLYVDHGSTFVGSQTRRILDTLGIILVHSRVRIPAGRGKQERFYRTTRDQFLRPLEAADTTPLADLNVAFHTWLESEYHRSPHRGLNKKTPLETWIERAHHIIPMDPAIDLDAAFLHEAHRKVQKDSTITLEGVLYEVPYDLVGERITLHYDPHKPPQRRRLLVSHQAQSYGQARVVDSYANARVRRGASRKDIVVQGDSEPAPDQPAHPPSPTDNSLSASHVDFTAQPPQEQDDE